MEQNKAEMRQILFEEFKGLADFCSFGQTNYHKKLDAVVARLAELQPVNKRQGIKDMKEIDPEIQTYVNEHFWEMLDSKPINQGE